MPELSSQDLLLRFQFFAAGEDLDVFEGALLVSALIDPDEDLAAARELVAGFASRVRDLVSGGDEPVEALRQVLFDEEGFGGDQESYDEPQNSSVARVIATHRGMPITLSIATVEIARQAGLRLTGIGLPGHFVVGGENLPQGTYLDAFDGGVLRDRDSVSQRVSAVFGTPLSLPDEIFAPDTERSILSRVLSNLRRSWERREKYAEALEALRWAEILDPEEVSYRRERGLLLLKSGRTDEALTALDSYVSASEGEDADAVQKLIGVVRERGLSSGGAELLVLETPQKKIFTLEQARSVLPKVKEVTSGSGFGTVNQRKNRSAGEVRKGSSADVVDGDVPPGR